MNQFPSLRAQTICFAAAQCVLLPCVVPAWAQDKTAAAQTSAPTQTRPASPVRVSLTLNETSLLQALKSLFAAANAQYNVNVGDLPNKPITLTIRDQPLDNALRLLLQQGNVEGRRLTYTIESGVYRIKNVAPVYTGGGGFGGGLGGGGFGGFATGSVRTERIVLLNVRPSDVMSRLQTAFPNSLLILPGTDASSLLVRGYEQQNQEVREMVSLLDTAPKTVVLKAEVVMVTDGGAKAGGKARSALLSTNLKTLSGQETTGDEKIMGTPTQSAKLQLNATPFLLGDSTFQVDTRWDVSLPLPTGKTNASGGKGAGLVRLEKRLTTTTRLKNGETALVGGVVLSQYGLKGEVLFFVTLNVVGP